jgi:hypothetical protein
MRPSYEEGIKQPLLRLIISNINTMKSHFVSMAQTFAATFILGVAAQIYQVGHVEWTYAFLASLILAGVRQVTKIGWEAQMPVALGGK